ncbi:MAG: hypothetical protein ABSB99_11630, partial [Acidimicrobiales bacterium]
TSVWAPSTTYAPTFGRVELGVVMVDLLRYVLRYRAPGRCVRRLPSPAVQFVAGDGLLGLL